MGSPRATVPRVRTDVVVTSPCSTRPGPLLVRGWRAPALYRPLPGTADAAGARKPLPPTGRPLFLFAKPGVRA